MARLLQGTFGGADQVFAYLGLYIHRVGISNARIQAADERAVTFATKKKAQRTGRPGAAPRAL